MCMGVPGATTMVRVLDAKLTGFPSSSPVWAALSILRVSAEADTSARAPRVSWVTRSEDPAKLNSTEALGLSVLNCSPISVMAALSEAVANTVSFPPAAALLGGDDDAVDVVPPELQPVIMVRSATADRARVFTRVMLVLKFVGPVTSCCYVLL